MGSYGSLDIMPNSKTIEATLFYQSAATLDFAALAAAMVNAFAGSNVRTRVRLMAQNDLAFAVGGLTMTLTRVVDPLSTEALSNCRRPMRPLINRQEALSGMRAHHSAIVLKISGPDYVAKTQTRLGICLMAAMQVFGIQKPDHVYWSASETLYSREEFMSVAAPQAAKAPESAAVGSSAMPQRATEANAWMRRAYSTSATPMANDTPMRRKPVHFATSSHQKDGPDRQHTASPYDANAVLQDNANRNRRSAAPMLNDLLKSLRAA